MTTRPLRIKKDHRFPDGGAVGRRSSESTRRMWDWSQGTFQAVLGMKVWRCSERPPKLAAFGKVLGSKPSWVKDAFEFCHFRTQMLSHAPPTFPQSRGDWDLGTFSVVNRQKLGNPYITTGTALPSDHRGIRETCDSLLLRWFDRDFWSMTSQVCNFLKIKKIGDQEGLRLQHLGSKNRKLKRMFLK